MKKSLHLKKYQKMILDQWMFGIHTNHLAFEEAFFSPFFERLTEQQHPLRNRLSIRQHPQPDPSDHQTMFLDVKNIPAQHLKRTRLCQHIERQKEQKYEKKQLLGVHYTKIKGIKPNKSW